MAMRRPVHAIFFAALAGAGACGSGGASGSSGGAGGHGGTGGAAGGPDFVSVATDAAPPPPGNQSDAGVTLSCAGATDGGIAACVQFDPAYAEPATVCEAHGFGAVVPAPCALDGSAGGCHVIDGASGYTVWSYAPETVGGAMFHCEQLGQSYVSASSDVETDAAWMPSYGVN